MIHELFSKIENHRNDAELVSDVKKLLGMTQKEQDCLAETFRIQQHPLGFLAFRWSLDETRSLRLHIWDKRFNWGQDSKWSIHDHSFRFTSLVLTGHLINCEYEIISNQHTRGSWSEYEVHYDGTTSKLRRAASSLTVLPSVSEIHGTGSFYNIQAGTAHKSDLVSPRAMTLVATTFDGNNPARPRVWAEDSVDTLEFDRIVSSPTLVQVAILDAINDLSIAGS